MTGYSVVPSAQRATVITTCLGAWSDHSANVTTLTDASLASCLGSPLPRLSEDAWDAATFLDTSPALELAVSRLVEQLRSPAVAIGPVRPDMGGFRHAHHWSSVDAAELLATDMPSAPTQSGY